MSFDARLDYDRDTLIERIQEMEARIEDLSEELATSNHLATLGTLVGMVAHEFNNLLTPVMSYAQLALKSPEDRELVQKALTRALESTEQVARVASAILGFIRDDRQLDTADVNRVLDEALLCMAGKPEKSGITIDRHIPQGMRVAMRPVSLQQVMLNLLLNALDAMKDERGTISIECELTENGRVTLTVADTGRGMTRQEAERIFQVFVSRDSGPYAGIGGPPSAWGCRSSRSRRGHGLGLAICRRLITEAGGHISLKSKPGSGTTFTINLGIAAEHGLRSA